MLRSDAARREVAPRVPAPLLPPACFSRMLWGRPRTTYETYTCRFDSGGAGAGTCYLHDDGSRVYEFPEGTFALSAAGGEPVNRPDEQHDEPEEGDEDDEDDDDEAEVGIRKTCPICVRDLSFRSNAVADAIPLPPCDGHS